MLAVLAGTGIASPHVPMNDSWAVKGLHVAAQGGSAQADLALAHRYFMADGVPGNCQEGLRSAPESSCFSICHAKGDTANPDPPWHVCKLVLVLDMAPSSTFGVICISKQDVARSA